MEAKGMKPAETQVVGAKALRVHVPIKNKPKQSGTPWDFTTSCQYRKQKPSLYFDRSIVLGKGGGTLAGSSPDWSAPLKLQE